MFYDERINAECGKLYQKGILYATIVTAIFGGLRAVELSMLDGLAIRYLLTELTILISGILILLIGFIRFRANRDERVIFEKHNYYLNAGKTFLLLALSGYVIYIPFSLEGNASSMPPNQLIQMLEVLGCIYFCYHFKDKGISFNYSFIDEEHYYRHVFANIGKMAGVLAIAFSASLVIDLALHHSIVNFLIITAAYLFSVVGLGLEYWFISWVERVSYRHENENRLNKGTLIALIAYLIVRCELCFLDCIYYVVLEKGFSVFDPVGEILGTISMNRLPLSILSVALWAICLCCLMAQIKKSRVACRAIYATIVLTGISVVRTSFLRYYVVRFLETIIMPTQDTLLFPRALNMLNGIAYLLNAILLFFMWVLILGLITDIKMTKAVIFVPLLQSISVPITWFLQSQDLLAMSVSIQSVLILSSLILLTVFLNKHSYGEVTSSPPQPPAPVE